MDILYADRFLLVCIKPAGVLSTDEPGGLPNLLREALGKPKANIRTVHRLDRVVSGLMVLARSSAAASVLSEQVRDGRFHKQYLAVVHGLTEPEGQMRDLLARDKNERKTYVTDTPGKEAREAILNYVTLAQKDGLSLVKIELITGRTHQIRCQFSSRGFELVGDKKYSLRQDDCDIALWSCCLDFFHPDTGENVHFEQEPPKVWPWNLFYPQKAETGENSTNVHE